MGGRTGQCGSGVSGADRPSRKVGEGSSRPGAGIVDAARPSAPARVTP